MQVKDLLPKELWPQYDAKLRAGYNSDRAVSYTALEALLEQERRNLVEGRDQYTEAEVRQATVHMHQNVLLLYFQNGVLIRRSDTLQAIALAGCFLLAMILWRIW